MADGKNGNGNGDRDAKGKFAPGHAAYRNGGKPRAIEKEYEAEYLAALRKTLKMDDWMQIVAKQVQRAIGGNIEAAKWLASYAIGQPRQSIDIDAETFTKMDIYTEAVRKTLE